MSKTKKTATGTEPTKAQREQMYQLWVKDVPPAEIMETVGVGKTTFHKYKKVDDWEGRKAKEDQDNRALAEVARTIIQKSPEDIRKGTIKEMEMALYFRAKRVRENIQNGQDDAGITSELQKMASALEKNQSTEVKAATGGVKKSEVHIKQEKIDWNEIIKLSIEAKKKHGDNFDEQKFLEDAINVSVKKD